MKQLQLPITPLPTKAPTIINFVRFVSRDGLSFEMPYGKDDKVPSKAWRKLRSTVLIDGQEDERPEPNPNDPHFKERMRAYSFQGVQRDPATGILTAIYGED
jgi:hypothetical protein